MAFSAYQTPLYWLFRKYFRIALSSSISVSVTLDGRVWRQYSGYSHGINFHIWMLEKYLIWKYLRYPVAVSYLFLFKNDLGDIGANILGSAIVFYWISVRLQYFLSSNFVIFYYFYSDILSYWLSLSHTHTFSLSQLAISPSPPFTSPRWICVRIILAHKELSNWRTLSKRMRWNGCRVLFRKENVHTEMFFFPIFSKLCHWKFSISFQFDFLTKNRHYARLIWIIIPLGMKGRRRWRR